MDGYKHFIRVDGNNIIVDGYADWQNDKRSVDEIMISGEYGRQFTIQLTNDRKQFIYKLINGSITPRTQQELDLEWIARPAEPPTENERIKALEDAVLDLMLGGL